MLPVLLQVLSIGRIFISKINFFFIFFLPPLSSKVQWSSLRWATTYDGVCLMSDRSLWKGRTGIDYHSVYLRAHTISEISQFEIEWAWFRRSGCLTKNRFITFSAFRDKILGFLYETFKSKIFAARAHWGIVRRLVKNLVHVHRILPRDGSQKNKSSKQFFRLSIWVSL